MQSICTIPDSVFLDVTLQVVVMPALIVLYTFFVRKGMVKLLLPFCHNGFVNNGIDFCFRRSSLAFYSVYHDILRSEVRHFVTSDAYMRGKWRDTGGW